jgi:hypothetical protein
MTKQKRRKPTRRACPLCGEPRPNHGLPSTIPFGIPTHWSPDAALAVFDFIDGVRGIILAVYGTQIEDAARKQWPSQPAEPVAIPDDELPF